MLKNQLRSIGKGRDVIGKPAGGQRYSNAGEVRKRLSLRDRSPQVSNVLTAFFVLSRQPFATFFMTYRLRHCAECPKCGTRYLVGFSPYANGSYLLPVENGRNDQWTLYCRCISPPARSSWRATDLKTYDVSGRAHQRGYGSPEEVVQFGAKTQRWPSLR